MSDMEQLLPVNIFVPLLLQLHFLLVASRPLYVQCVTLKQLIWKLEPAGADGCPCCLVQRTMMVFNVDTASEGRALSIWGVDVPYELKQDVWSMKRGEGIEGVDMSSIAPSAVSMVGRDGGAGGVTGGGAGGKSSAETERLLGEILQTLKQQNELIELKGGKW